MQNSEYIKNHLTIHFKRVNYMVWGLDLNTGFIKNTEAPGHTVSSGPELGSVAGREMGQVNGRTME